MQNNNNGKTKIKTLCRMCADRCGIIVHLENDRIVDIEGNPGHPWNKGRMCVKGRAAVDMVYAPERLTKPLKKTKTGWQEIDLETALDEIAAKMLQIKEDHGARSIGVWKGEPLGGFNQQEKYMLRFCHAFGTPNYFTNNSTCFNARYIALSCVFGKDPTYDFANSKCILIWGANPPHAHPQMTRMIMEAKQKGAKLIVIDPRLSVIARKADLYVPVRPGTDGALALGIARIIIENDWHDREFIENHTIGFDKYSDYVKKFTDAYVQNETGIAISQIHKIASLISKNRPRIINYVGNGLEHHENGVNNMRAVACLDAICGSIDQKGGPLLPDKANLRELKLSATETNANINELIDQTKFPVVYDYRQECNTMAAFEATLTGDPYPMRGLIITAANPVITNPNSEKVVKALQKMELLVVRDLYMTKTAELADYVLPGSSFLEVSELFTHKLYQKIQLTQKALSLPLCQVEYDFWHDLAHRVGIGDYFPWENEMEVNRWLLEPVGITPEELAKSPEGYQFQPISYCKYTKSQLLTPSGKVEFTSEYLKNLGYPELPEYSSPAYLKKLQNKDANDLVMITGARSLLFYHSRNRNFPRFCKAYPNPEVEINPEDAKTLGIVDGEMVKITSSVGSIEIPAKIVASNEILQGCLQVTHGWEEANINMLTPDLINDPISGFPLMKAISVKLEKI